MPVTPSFLALLVVPAHVGETNVAQGTGAVMVFDTFHGGSAGNRRTADRRVHSFLSFGHSAFPSGGIEKHMLKQMLKNNDPDAAAYLDNVPTRAMLQKQVGKRISLVCKVNQRPKHEEYLRFVSVVFAMDELIKCL